MTVIVGVVCHLSSVVEISKVEWKRICGPAIMALDRTTQSAHHTWDQLSRYDRPTIEIETSTACVKDLQTATYAMVGVDRMVKGMDEGRQQSFPEAIQAVKDIDKGIDELIRVYVQMQLTHEQ